MSHYSVLFIPAEMNGHQEVHSRLLAVRSLLRLAFNGVNVLEGRPVEEYAVQNPPHLNTRRRDGASSSGATAAPEGGQVNEESTQVEGQASAEEPTEVGLLSVTPISNCFRASAHT